MSTPSLFYLVQASPTVPSLFHDCAPEIFLAVSQNPVPPTIQGLLYTIVHIRSGQTASHGFTISWARSGATMHMHMRITQRRHPSWFTGECWCWPFKSSIWAINACTNCFTDALRWMYLIQKIEPRLRPKTLACSHTSLVIQVLRPGESNSVLTAHYGVWSYSLIFNGLLLCIFNSLLVQRLRFTGLKGIWKDCLTWLQRSSGTLWSMNRSKRCGQWSNASKAFFRIGPSRDCRRIENHWLRLAHSYCPIMFPNRPGKYLLVHRHIYNTWIVHRLVITLFSICQKMNARPYHLSDSLHFVAMGLLSGTERGW